MTRLIDRLIEETRVLHQEAESEGEALLADTRVGMYHRYLSRWYGFVSPVERCLMDLDGLERVLDLRRLHKARLILHDLTTLGVKSAEIASLPQCMSVPLFDDVRDAVGWLFPIERSTLAHPTLFRRVAATMPGEVAFASSYLKCYFGAIGEMWWGYGDGLQAAVRGPEDEARIITAAKTSYRHFRRWRATLDGRTLSLVGDTPSQIREPT